MSAFALIGVLVIVGAILDDIRQWRTRRARDRRRGMRN